MPAHPTTRRGSRDIVRVSVNRPLSALRDRTSAYRLGIVDWLLRRRASNPYPDSSIRWRHYQSGFRTARRRFPQPNFPPLPSRLTR